MSPRGEMLAEWVGDLRGSLERFLARTPEAALHWRAARETTPSGTPSGTSRGGSTS